MWNLRGLKCEIWACRWSWIENSEIWLRVQIGTEICERSLKSHEISEIWSCLMLISDRSWKLVEVSEFWPGAVHFSARSWTLTENSEISRDFRRLETLPSDFWIQSHCSDRSWNLRGGCSQLHWFLFIKIWWVQAPVPFRSDIWKLEIGSELWSLMKVRRFEGCRPCPSGAERRSYAGPRKWRHTCSRATHHCCHVYASGPDWIFRVPLRFLCAALTKFHISDITLQCALTCCHIYVRYLIENLPEPSYLTTLISRLWRTAQFSVFRIQNSGRPFRSKVKFGQISEAHPKFQVSSELRLKNLKSQRSDFRFQNSSELWLRNQKCEISEFRFHFPSEE